jgi:hypothetical protein
MRTTRRIDSRGRKVEPGTLHWILTQKFEQGPRFFHSFIRNVLFKLPWQNFNQANVMEEPTFWRMWICDLRFAEGVQAGQIAFRAL